jgi:hypothetical protein
MKDSIKLTLIICIIIASCIFISLIGGIIKFPEAGIRNTTSTTTVSTPAQPLGKDLFHISRTTNLVTINATVKGYSYTSLPLCRGTLTENGSIDLHLKSSGEIRWNVTSEEDAPEVAWRVMESYGGIPPDAVPNGASTHYSREYNLSRNEIVSKKPMFTSISYSQKDINGLWVIGDTNFLTLDLGNNGEPLWIYKIWRNYSCTGNVPLIPLYSAIEKLDRQELLRSEWHPEAGDITIDTISPGYYAKKLPDNNTVLEPIWMFFGGNATTSARLGFYVYARQFANFTANPASGEVPLFVNFTDISDTSPEKWLWDFGDGITSTSRNSTHTYQRSGIYNVTLTVWNDLGSDTVSKKNLVTILPAGTAAQGPVRPEKVNATGIPARGR